MDDGTLLDELEKLAERLGIDIRYGKIGVEESRRMGGLCRVHGRYVLIMHSGLSKKDKIAVILKTLKGFEIGDIYVKPLIRELLNPPGERGLPTERIP